MLGVVHHLADEHASRVLARLASCSTLCSLATLDPVRVPRAPMNDLLCALDSGRYVRTASAYRALLKEAGWTIEHEAIERAGRGLSRYCVTRLTRARRL